MERITTPILQTPSAAEPTPVGEIITGIVGIVVAVMAIGEAGNALYKAYKDSAFIDLDKDALPQIIIDPLPQIGGGVMEQLPLPEQNKGTGIESLPAPSENTGGTTALPLPEESESLIITADGDDTKTNKIPDNDSVTGHIFKDGKGHIPDTPENRALLEDTANNPDNFRGYDMYKNEWYAYIQPDGSQVWVEARNGIIFEGGVNKTPLPWNDMTGFKKP